MSSRFRVVYGLIDPGLLFLGSSGSRVLLPGQGFRPSAGSSSPLRHQQAGMLAYTCDRDPPDLVGGGRGRRSEFRLQTARDRVDAELQTGQIPGTTTTTFVWLEHYDSTGRPLIVPEAGKR